MEPNINIATGTTETDDSSLPLGLGEADAALVEDIAALCSEGQRGMVLNIVTDMRSADLAALLEHLSIDNARVLFRWLPVEVGSEVLPELDDDFRAALLEEARTERIAALIDSLDTDDAVDVLADLPAEIADEVLPTLEDATELRSLLTYDEESAGGIMGTEFVTVTSTWTVAEATEEVRRNADAVEAIYALFVTDEDGKYIGAVSLKRLLLSPSTAMIGNIIDIDDIAVTTDVDQEDVARIMERYDMVSIPVVDAGRAVVGRITIDDIVDVIREEAEEDIQRMSGVSGGEEATDSIMRITRGRLPWLLAGLVGAGLSAFVIGSFEEALSQAVVLAAFIPIVMATAGNAGIQSSAIAVQGLASGHVWTTDLMRRLGKELVVSLINGVALALVLGVAVIIVVNAANTVRLAVTAALTLIVVIILATTIGATVPLLLHRFGVDPAIATGPFITTTNDILGIVIFFVLATMIYLV